MLGEQPIQNIMDSNPTREQSNRNFLGWSLDNEPVMEDIPGENVSVLGSDMDENVCGHDGAHPGHEIPTVEGSHAEDRIVDGHCRSINTIKHNVDTEIECGTVYERECESECNRFKKN